MARKKRSVAAVEVATAEKKEVPRYQDAFQQRVGRTIEDAGKKVEGHGRTILYGIAALIVLGVIGWMIYAWTERSSAAGQAALGKAIETSQAPVSETPIAGSTTRTFKNERERAEAAIAEFEKVAELYGGEIADKARYFAAVNRLQVDRAAATQQLEAMAGSNDAVGKLAKFSLAQVMTDDGNLDRAAALYQELAAMDQPLPAKDTINFELAKIYEKQGKKQEAADLLYNVVKNASEAKDLEGKPVPLTGAAQSAKEKLQELDPQRAQEIQTPVTDSALGAAPGM